MIDLEPDQVASTAIALSALLGEMPVDVRNGVRAFRAQQPCPSLSDNAAPHLLVAVVIASAPRLPKLRVAQLVPLVSL